MKFLKALAILFFVGFISVFAQDTTATPITIPTGFNWIYLVFFGLGMVVHYGYKIYQTFGTLNYLQKFGSNLFGWFVNKFHWTLIAGGAAAVIGVAVQYGLPAEFATLNVIGIGIAIIAGYIGDMANQGVLK